MINPQGTYARGLQQSFQFVVFNCLSCRFLKMADSFNHGMMYEMEADDDFKFKFWPCSQETVENCAVQEST